MTHPDAGMSAIAAAYAAGSTAAPPNPAAPGEAGADLAVNVRLAVALENMAGQLARDRARARASWEVCHPIPLNPISATAAGNLSDDRWEPREGFAWQLTRLSVRSGTATGWEFHRDSTVDGAWVMNGVASGLTAGFNAIWEPKGEFILPGNRVIPVAIGGSAIFNGSAIEIALDWLPAYLL